MKAWEKELIGMNKHCVYSRCYECQSWGINFPLDNRCGNCNTERPTTTYYDEDTIDLLLQSEVDKRVREREEQIAREAFEAARIHPNWCDKVIIEKYVHEGDGNSAGTYYIAKKINYEYESFEDYKKSKEVKEIDV
jgi:hypothetical protein